MAETPRHDEGKKTPRISRRKFVIRTSAWTLGIVGAGVLGTGAYAHWIEPFWVKHHDVEVKIPGLPPSFDGFKIAHVSDLHCGAGLRGEEVRSVLEEVVARKPDIVAITGDIVLNALDAYDIALAEVKFIASKIPTYIVPGNHDYWEGIENYYGGVPKTGAVELTNRHVVIARGADKIVLCGLDDLWEGDPDLDKALTGVDRKAQPVVCLLHNPDHYIKVRGSGVDLVLAGHTHGGQVKPPFFRAPVVPIRQKKYTRGFFREMGTALYVSVGVGMLTQIRFNCRPEVAYIILRPAD
ncbi:MAG: metallophosphoesterase [Planctomycetota bacterium]|jgi:predicted MPP superfamily phosphohydrolase